VKYLKEHPVVVDATTSQDPYETIGASFQTWFANHKTGAYADKWLPYFKAYDRHFGRFRNKKVIMMEIGVQSGGSTYMWQEYFGAGLEYYGVDINQNCKQFERSGVKIFIADQSNAASLKQLFTQIPRPDIILDDGGHTVLQQVTSFKTLYPWLKTSGVYMVEDLHTNYWPSFGGGLDKPDTFVEYSKHLIDVLNSAHLSGALEYAKGYFENIRSVAYYDSIAVYEKGKPVNMQKIQAGDFKIPYRK